MIDENGYLFGAVNVIDALVLAVLAAMIGAGLAVANINDGVVVTVPLTVVISGLLVFTVSSDTDDPQTEVEQETWYMTLDLGTQPAYVVDRIGEGDAIVVTEFDEPISVVDVHTPFSTGPSSITLRAEVIGGFREDEYGRPVFHFDGEPLLLGTELTLDLGSCVTNATVSELERDSPSLSVEETTVVAAVAIDNVSPTIAAGLEEGMVETVRDEPVATIDSVEREPATVYREGETGNTNGQEHPQNVDVKLQIVLRTTKTETGLHFRGERLTLGTTIGLDFGPVAVDGKVTRIDSSNRTRSVPETSSRLSSAE